MYLSSLQTRINTVEELYEYSLDWSTLNVFDVACKAIYLELTVKAVDKMHSMQSQVVHSQTFNQV